MRTLFLHPQDVPTRGPWSTQRWDLIVDLGKSSRFSREAWSRQFGCDVISVGGGEGIEVVRTAGRMLDSGLGQVIDEEGIDWWELTSLYIAPQLMTLLSLQQSVGNIPPGAELWATRRGAPLRILEVLLGRSVNCFGRSVGSQFASRLAHYGDVFRRLSMAQVKEIAFDKYDSGYKWRSRFARRQVPVLASVVLVPSAYGNVSRMAMDYARLLPEQRFLMVTTRASARVYEPAANVLMRDLAAYATNKDAGSETEALLVRWSNCKKELQKVPELEVLVRAGALDPISEWIRNGVRARNAWRQVLKREPVQAVFCGDDSNFYTRLPVELAVRRKIPTVDFHHGALDGRYLMKRLPCDLYLAKSELERDYLLRLCGLPEARIVVGSPPHQLPTSPGVSASAPQTRDAAILFSEPYEVTGTRAEEMYREILPNLCRVARQNARTVIVKLHPFESISDRRKMICQVLGPEEAKNVAVMVGPLTPQLLARAWFGITVESTTVLDCLKSGVQCFLCGWMSLSPCQYAEQYVRFGVGELLTDVNQIAEIPQRLEHFRLRPQARQSDLFPAMDPNLLRQWLLGHSVAVTRPVS